ncbi:DUF4145 domain-containing protein [Aeromonas sp. sif0611]|uniref:DUF4145 domain-containing protein n=1 Tax=Aeromonas sp. sif0611 TaxID=2854787 RepID=UPI001C4621EB|nr:DUF4145 domain-containing protein [Aeromonas sp. sif0611]MBV7469143.1 DUF4145 domain-containing protein [Aeromonas sp. sif0611]
MKNQHYPPTYRAEKFHCPYCGVYSHQKWMAMTFNHMSAVRQTEEREPEFMGACCEHCEQHSVWSNKRLVFPYASQAEPMHQDLPEECRAEYEEARDIVGRSPRGAAALLRLCLQKLMPHLGEQGKNINEDIKSLVAKGLSPVVQKALDFCRVVGNNAVHPGELTIEDTPEIAQQLFKMINFIVEDRITRPKEVQALYDQLPKNSKDGIAKRDAAKQPDR